MLEWDGVLNEKCPEFVANFDPGVMIDMPAEAVARHKSALGMLNEAIWRCHAEVAATPIAGDNQSNLEPALTASCNCAVLLSGQGIATQPVRISAALAPVTVFYKFMTVMSKPLVPK